MGILDQVMKRGLSWYIHRANRNCLKNTDGPVSMPELSGRAEVITDKWGVPHVYADDVHDVLRVQGYLHARHRLFQMDLSRRVASGTLAEWLGEAALDTDRLVRTAGLHVLAQKDLDALDPEEVMLLEAYSEGVNHGISRMRKDLPSEYKLLRVQPQRWTAYHTLAISRLMMWQMSRGWFYELVQTWLLEKAGVQMSGELGFNYPENQPLGLPSGIEFNELMEDGMLRAASGPFLGQYGGSNAWALSGKKTQSGHAMLCNDPHLPMGLPSVWFENHLSSPNMEVTGVSVPGIPFVVIGHNRDISWGVTLAYIDAEDLVLHEFEEGMNYRTPEGLKTARHRTEIILVKGQNAHIEKVVETIHGPLLSPLIQEPGGGATQRKISLCSKALQTSRGIQTFFKLNYAGGWNDFVEAMKECSTPPLNVAYADKKGNIGYWVTGEVPIREGGYTGFPAQAATGKGIWKGKIPFEEMPHALNPERGYLITCNHKIVDERYPHELGDIWMLGNRAQRAEQRLAAVDKLSSKMCGEIQNELRSEAVPLYKALFEEFEPENNRQRQLVKLLFEWDGELTAGSSGAAIYGVLRRKLTLALLEAGLGDAPVPELLGKGLHPVIFGLSEFYARESEFVPRILSTPDSVMLWKAGGLSKLLAQALDTTDEWLSNRFGGDPLKWSWGQVHNITWKHPLSVRAPLDSIYNIGSYPLGGDSDTLAQAGYTTAFNDDLCCASWRQIIDTGDWDQSMAVLPPGNSGMLGDTHYADQAEMWLKGQYRPMLWSRSNVEKYAEAKQQFQPAAQI